jgi:hypothetical protein
MGMDIANLATLGMRFGNPEVVLGNLPPRIGNPGRKFGNPALTPCQNDGTKHEWVRISIAAVRSNSQDCIQSAHTNFPDSIHSAGALRQTVYCSSEQFYKQYTNCPAQVTQYTVYEA